MCHHVDVCLAAVCAEVLLLGRVRDWPQLEVWYGLPGTPDRSHRGLPGLCGTLHVQQCQPSVLDCQVRDCEKLRAGTNHTSGAFGREAATAIAADRAGEPVDLSMSSLLEAGSSMQFAAAMQRPCVTYVCCLACLLGCALCCRSCILPVFCASTLLMTSCRDPGILPRQEPDEEWLQARKPRSDHSSRRTHCLLPAPALCITRMGVAVGLCSCPLSLQLKNQSLSSVGSAQVAPM